MAKIFNIWNFEALRQELLQSNDADFAALCVEAVAEYSGDDPEFYHAVRLNSNRQVVIDFKDGVIIVDPNAPDPLQLEVYHMELDWRFWKVAVRPAEGFRCVFTFSDPVSAGLLRRTIVERLRELWEFAKDLRE